MIQKDLIAILDELLCKDIPCIDVHNYLSDEEIAMLLHTEEEVA